MTMQVANTILAQLGGNRFLAMTGARNLVGGDNRLTMKLPRTAGQRVNCVRITLTAMDDYIVEGLNIRGLNVKPVAFRQGVYAETLPEVFTSITGLYTRL
jgi:hypothetical protein